MVNIIFDRFGTLEMICQNIDSENDRLQVDNTFQLFQTFHSEEKNIYSVRIQDGFQLSNFSMISIRFENSADSENH